MKWNRWRRPSRQELLAPLVQRLDGYSTRVESQHGAIEALTARLGNTPDVVGLHSAQIAELAGRADAVNAEVNLAATRIDELGQRMDGLSAGLVELSTSVRELSERINSVNQTIDRIAAELRAEPYLALPELLHRGGASGPLGYDSTPSSDDAYVLFESIFRGSEEFIRDRQRGYLNWIPAGSHVVDVGCGRGEMLDLLREHNCVAVGIELDHGMASRANARGHTIIEADAVRWLQEQPEASLDVIFSAQVIEHLPHDDLLQLLSASHRALRPGGRFIAETVNPHSVAAWKTFYIDLTHQRPIFPETLLVLCMSAGFGEATIVYPLSEGDFVADRVDRGEFAVVATR
jgi:SAM-dependent methyltransferase